MTGINHIILQGKELEGFPHVFFSRKSLAIWRSFESIVFLDDKMSIQKRRRREKGGTHKTIAGSNFSQIKCFDLQ